MSNGDSHPASTAPPADKDKNFLKSAVGGVAGVGQQVGAGIGKGIGGAGKVVVGGGKAVVGAPKQIGDAMQGGSSKRRHQARSEEAEPAEKVDTPQLNDQDNPELAKRPAESDMKMAYVGIAVVLVTVAFRFHWAVLLVLALAAGGVYYYAQQQGNTKPPAE